MNTVVACLFVALAGVVLGQPQGGAECIDKECHQQCSQDAGYSVGFCVNEVCECVPIESSQNVLHYDQHNRGSIIGDIIDSIKGDCNVISCVVSCAKKKTFGTCLLGECKCI